MYSFLINYFCILLNCHTKYINVFIFTEKIMKNFKNQMDSEFKTSELTK